MAVSKLMANGLNRTAVNNSLQTLKNYALGDKGLKVVLIFVFLHSFHVNEVKERFAGSRCRHNHKFGNFTSSDRQRQRNVLKCVPHVQRDYLSSLNQSHDR